MKKICILQHKLSKIYTITYICNRSKHQSKSHDHYKLRGAEAQAMICAVLQNEHYLISSVALTLCSYLITSHFTCLKFCSVLSYTPETFDLIYDIICFSVFVGYCIWKVSFLLKKQFSQKLGRDALLWSASRRILNSYVSRVKFYFLENCCSVWNL